MKIAIIGAGAIGGYVGVKLALAGEDVTFIVRGANLEAIRKNGMKLVEHDGTEQVARNVKATNDYTEAGVQDMVILAMKAHQLEAVANDVTSADELNRDPSFAQWVRAKGHDTFCPFGPTVATGLDPATLVVKTTLNGSLRQDYPVSDMRFSVAQLVSMVSQDMTLLPGDIILCGTSVGVGSMKPGSTVEVTIDGIGTLINRFE